MAMWYWNAQEYNFKYVHNKQFKQTVNAWHFYLSLASVIMVVILNVLVALSAT
ncbi:hypothetical protein [Vibrio gallaecicus]|uniref:hypothetical protein n=1 Tax=Vibrio gallaecicus TaxID=552386 RepID=UPI0025B60AA2|nr:DUF3265 domain-containing protein [Vibrio gallaecicus]MDN3617415.1 DUF3265 domain-containing protein [Vibrio gallaecicus]